MAKFADVLTIVNGKNQKKVENPHGKYPVYGSGGIMGYADDYICEAETVVLGRKGSINNPIFVETPFWNVDTAFGLHAECSKLFPKYLYYFCVNYDFERLNTTVTIPSLTKANLLNVEIPLPPLEEQRRIAALLDKVSDLIAKRRAQLDKLDLLVKARFVEIFGDLAAPECPHKKCKLVETCVSSDDIKCGPFGTQLSKEEYQDHGVAVWEIPQINSYFTTQPTHFLTVEKAEQLKAYSIIPGDIAMSRKGNVGRCALFPDNFDSGIIHSDVLRIRVDKQQVNPCFMMYQLHFSGAVQRQIEVVSSGAIMAGVNVTKLKHIEIHLPDFDLQQQFAHFVGEVDRVKYSINNSLEKLETLKKALMQQYFGGGGNVENC